MQLRMVAPRLRGRVSQDWANTFRGELEAIRKEAANFWYFAHSDRDRLAGVEG